MKNINNKIFYLYYEVTLFLKGIDPIGSAKVNFTMTINFILILPILCLIFLKISNDSIGFTIINFLSFISYFFVSKYYTNKIFTKERLKCIIKNRIKNKYYRITIIIFTIIFGCIIYASPIFTLIFISKMLK